MPDNEIMLIFKLLKMFQLSLKLLAGILIYSGIEHSKKSLMYLANGKKRDIKLLVLLVPLSNAFIP